MLSTTLLQQEWQETIPAYGKEKEDNYGFPFMIRHH